jgi:crotonobetainyl-CoA:carnitine CoA-transferase CaiB-like acyl-CoA transferase
MDKKPLEGIRILDLSRLLPGPFCTLLLADLGAEVIKVEDVAGGDYIRAMAPSIGGRGAYFLALNPGKKSLALNLKLARGREVFFRLAGTAQVIMESFRPGTVDRLGIGFEAVKTVNPGIVYSSISGYGQDGPSRDRAGHDLNYIARAGILGLTGTVGVTPPIPPVQIADLSSAMYAAVAILAALRESERSGEGRHLDIGMMDSALSWMIMTVAEFAAGEKNGRGRLHLTGKYPCYNVYRTKDGREVTLAALETKFWSDFCRAAGRPDVVDLQYSEEPQAFAEIAAVFAGRTRDEWAALAKDGDFCCEPVLSLDEALLDAQVRHRGLVRLTKAGEESDIELGNPLRRLAKTEPGKPPDHGEHTWVLLRELGYSDQELAELEASGAILGRRP